MVQPQRREAEEHKPALSHEPEQADPHTVQHDTATSVTRNRTQSHNLIGWGSHPRRHNEASRTLCLRPHTATQGPTLLRKEKG